MYLDIEIRLVRIILACSAPHAYNDTHQHERWRIQCSTADPHPEYNPEGASGSLRDSWPEAAVPAGFTAIMQCWRSASNPRQQGEYAASSALRRDGLIRIAEMRGQMDALSRTVVGLPLLFLGLLPQCSPYI